jgi:predicted nucleic acid-binding protein
MVLVDTSVWVDHFRHGNDRLVVALEAGYVWVHPFVIGELACGHLQRRQEILSMLSRLPQAVPATHNEVLHFIETHVLAGKGLGWVDVNLLASAALAGLSIWTLDRRLAIAAKAAIPE